MGCQVPKRALEGLINISSFRGLAKQKLNMLLCHSNGPNPKGDCKVRNGTREVRPRTSGSRCLYTQVKSLTVGHVVFHRLRGAKAPEKVRAVLWFGDRAHKSATYTKFGGTTPLILRKIAHSPNLGCAGLKKPTAAFLQPTIKNPDLALPRRGLKLPGGQDVQDSAAAREKDPAEQI